MGDIPLAVLEKRRETGNTLPFDVTIRCSRQSEDQPLKRPRFVFNLKELSGALGDLGTFLPHVLGAISVAGLSPAGVFVAFGLFYLGSGVIYGIPIAVQPMKAASAALLIQGMSPAEVAAGALLIGIFFLVAGLTGLVNLLARITPAWTVAAIQLSLGSSLAWLGLKLAWSQPLLGGIVVTIMLASIFVRRVPAALVGLVIGVGLAFPLGINTSIPKLDWGWHLPVGVIPGMQDFLRASYVTVLPQIPLTLTNALIVTSALAHRYFPKEKHHATVRNLSLSTGIGNLMSALLGGYMMCHGAGGLAGHYRFGARTGGAPVMIGAFFLLLGLFLGGGGLALLALIPVAVVGSLLLFSGIELASSSRAWRFPRLTAGLAAGIAVLGFAVNLAVAFAVALALSWLLRRWRPDLLPASTSTESNDEYLCSRDQPSEAN
ncbi:MAG: putative sulfate/molybdate transporter [Dehalococcoidales bacterium]|nr:putative sulfate/molybdate transporter [Dehalococcoidales bacterium]